MPKQKNFSEKKIKESSNKRLLKSYFTLVGILILAWLIPASWVALSPPFSPPFQPTKETRKRLNQIKKNLKIYIKKHQTAPKDLATLRAFSLSHQLSFDAYDAFGQRLQYSRLSEKNYFIRSFGADGVQNTLNSAPDISLIRWGEVPSLSPYYDWHRSLAPISYFPALLLQGSESSNQEWIAKVFSDQGLLTRQLLLRHRVKEGIFMVAPHDRVEEFLWLPNSEKIIYSATGSTRHRDGIFLWDLKEDSIINLIDFVDDSVPISPAARSIGFFFSLAGITQNSQNKSVTVYSFFGFRNQVALAPQDFFSKRNLIAFSIPDGNGDKNQKPKFLGRFPDIGVTFPLPFVLNANVVPRGGDEIQKKWLSLKVIGDTEETLIAWQRFMEEETSSPLFPYALWIVSLLYSDTYQSMFSVSREEAEVIRSYGSELSRALIDYPLSPTYIRALAIFLYDQFMDGRPLDLKIGRLSLPANEKFSKMLNPSLMQPKEHTHP